MSTASYPLAAPSIPGTKECKTVSITYAMLVIILSVMFIAGYAASMMTKPAGADAVPTSVPTTIAVPAEAPKAP